MWSPPSEKKPVPPTKKPWDEVKPGECFVHPSSDMKGIIFRKKAEKEYELAGSIKVFLPNPLPEIPSDVEVEVVEGPAAST